MRVQQGRRRIPLCSFLYHHSRGKILFSCMSFFFFFFLSTFFTMAEGKDILIVKTIIDRKCKNVSEPLFIFTL